jgi:hypothetical protein
MKGYWRTVTVCAAAFQSLAVSAEPRPWSLGGAAHCGAKALALFLEVEHRRVPASFFEQSWASSTSGASMYQLQRVAAANGVKLVGVHLAPRGGGIDRTTIVYLRYGPHGHYAVVRPVGQSGKLLQVLDPSGSPRIIDRERLFAAPEWTGLALVLVRPNWPARIAWAIGGGTFASGLTALALAGIRRRARLPGRFGAAERPIETRSP